MLDPISFKKLEGIKQKHGNDTYTATASIKRAIAITEFIDEQIAQGMNVFVGDNKGNIHQVAFVN